MNISKLHQLFLETNGVSTDTRNIKKNSMFFALKGANFNGNQYATQAIENGAHYAIIDEKKYKTSDKHILVNDSLKTLQQLAARHRIHLGIPIIALTGSNGKTTTKELINAVLSTAYNTTATKGNLNNHIGVPLTLLSMDNTTEIGIVEMGANHLKEIDFLCTIATPNYGYITNIGKAHLEGFGSLEGVLKGKTELYQYLKNNDQFIFLNTEDQKLSQAAIGINTYTFSQNTKTDITVLFKNADPMVQAIFNNQIINSQLIGAYNFTNISAAITIGAYFNISTEKIKKAIESYTPSNNRSQIIHKNNKTIILDAYNANPTSMSAALHNFEKQNYHTKTIFIGDMFELGNEANKEHQQIVTSLSNLKSFDQIYLIGKLFSETTTQDTRIHKYLSFEDLANTHTLQSDQSTAILIKGSRGMKLERILELIN